MEDKAHRDCDRYQSVDAFKGFCRRQKTLVAADEPACEHFTAAPKCGLCSNFTPTTPTLGKCKSTVIAYADMLAKTCKEYSGR